MAQKINWVEGRITLSEAIELWEQKGGKVSRPTAAEWVKKYNLGIQLGDNHGRYVIDKKRWIMFINTGDYYDAPPEPDNDIEEVTE